MKKIMIIASFFLLSILLAGCMSIPGIFKEETDTNEVTEEIEVQEEPDEIEERERELEERERELEEREKKENELEEAVNTEETDASATDSKTIKDCDDDYSVFLENFPDDFPMPECAIIESVLVDDRRVDASYEVEDDWSDLYYFYKDYYGENITEENQVLNEQKGTLTGEIDGEKLNIEINQHENNNVKVRAFYRFPE